MAETHKIYTSYPPTNNPSTYNYPKYEPNPWGLAFFFLIIGFVVIMWLGYRIMNWWDSLGTTYTPKRNSYYDYPKNKTTKIDCSNSTNNTTMLAKPKVNRWISPLWKPKPVVPPRMLVAGRMNGVDFQYEGPDETKYLSWYDRDQWYDQKGIYGPKRLEMENKLKNGVYNGT